MKLVVAAALVLVATFAFAVGCRHEATPPQQPQSPSAYAPADAGPQVPDAPGAKGEDTSLGFPGTRHN